MQVLRLILSAPLMSFGDLSLNDDRKTRLLPGRSMLTGLLANALGLDLVHDRAAHQELQDRLRFAAGHLRDTPELERDFQTAFTRRTDALWSRLGDLQKRGAHTATHAGGPANLTKHYLTGARVGVGIVLDGPGAHTLDDLAAALRQPARTLYIGRKHCLPDTRPCAGIVDAPHPAAAVADMLECDGALACWDIGYGPDRGRETAISDRMDWISHIHRGRSIVREDHLTPADGAAGQEMAIDRLDAPTPERPGLDITHTAAEDADDLQMTRIELAIPKLAQWLVAKDFRHADRGYLAHLVTRVLFDDAAPQPFRTHESGGRLQITGYTRQTAEQLAARLDGHPHAGLVRAIHSAGVPQLAAGQHVSYTLDLVASRRVRGRERDAYDPNAHRSRADCYRDRLARQLAPGARLQDGEMTEFNIRPLTRRDARRGLRVIRLPVARFQGTLCIDDPAEFRALLRRGVGRHTAFGAGALALAPA